MRFQIQAETQSPVAGGCRPVTQKRERAITCPEARTPRKSAPPEALSFALEAPALCATPPAPGTD
eukprot:1601125-Alexandrium_andersonii.AAC.1